MSARDPLRIESRTADPRSLDSERQRRAGIPHYQQTQHACDRPHPRGVQHVRVDGGGAATAIGDREYVAVATGYGEGRRAAAARRKHRGETETT